MQTCERTCCDQESQCMHFRLFLHAHVRQAPVKPMSSVFSAACCVKPCTFTHIRPWSRVSNLSWRVSGPWSVPNQACGHHSMPGTMGCICSRGHPWRTWPQHCAKRTLVDTVVSACCAGRLCAAPWPRREMTGVCMVWLAQTAEQQHVSKISRHLLNATAGIPTQPLVFNGHARLDK